MSVIHCTRGSIAVEFSLVAPLFMALLFGIVAFGSVLCVNLGLQQIVAEAVRATVPGLSDVERTSLAQASISANVASYAFIDPAKLTLNTADPSGTYFQVSVRYDMSGLVAYRLLPWLPLPSPIVTRSATIQLGGF